MVSCKYLASYWSDDIRGEYQIVDLNSLYKKGPMQLSRKTSRFRDMTQRIYQSRSMRSFPHHIQSRMQGAFFYMVSPVGLNHFKQGYDINNWKQILVD